jgi:hypothetical protein
MILYERFADKGYHTSVATTFGLDFDAYESIVLPRLRGAGCRNNIVIPDNRMLTHALAGASVLPRHAGRLYTVSGATARGAFHPKLFLQVGRRGGRLIMGSANLTASGLAGNLELVSAITCTEEDSGEQRLVARAWEYASRFIDTSQQAFAGQREWTLRRAPWLRRATPGIGPVLLSDGTMAALLTTGENGGIGTRFAALVDEPITQLIVISPYWDLSLQALSHLIERLAPARTAMLLDPEAVSFPKEALSHVPNVQLYRRGKFGGRRFIHAKAIIAQGAGTDHVLIGSANCTIAGLGAANYAGDNEEVCLYRRFPSGEILDVLKLSEVLVSELRIDPGTLGEPVVADELPLDELGARMPGQFECQIDVLSWRPPNSVDVDRCKIELLDQQGQSIECTLLPLASDGDTRRYQITNSSERPAFARIILPNGMPSVPAIVTLIDRLRAVIRESQSRKVENALRDLDSETEARLSLLEILDVLEKLDTADGAPHDPMSVAQKRKEDEGKPGPSDYRVLTYEQFIAGRRPRNEKAHLTHNSLAGSETSLVRGFLNRLLGMTAEAHDADDDDENSLAGAFDLGDETANLEAGMDAGQELSKKKEPPSTEEQEQQLLKRRAAQRKATKEQILTAAAAFGKRIKERQQSGALDNHDILRLRALLMIICAASWSGAEKNARARSSIHVLSGEGDQDSWPFVMGRALFTIFGGRDPAIRFLYLSGVHDQIPDDITECWATCYWCLQACLAAPVSRTGKNRISQFLKPLSVLAYQLTLPSKAELLGDDVIMLMDGMSKRYAGSIGIDAAAIRDGHQALVEELFGKQCSTHVL